MGTVIQFIPKKAPRTVRSKAVGEEIEFVVMWPQDWEEEHWPSMYELENTLMTVKCYKAKLINKLATAGVSEEFKIREGLGQLDRMYEMLIFYLRAD